MIEKNTCANKVVIFDWGGVVESHEHNQKELNDAKIRLIEKFTKKLSGEEILSRFVYETKDGTKTGTINEEEKIREWVSFLEEKMEVMLPFEEFKKQYEKEFSSISYYKDVAIYAHSLKGRCKIAILSNLGPFDKVRINSQYDLSKFDFVYLSFEIGIRKPDRRIYEYVQEDLKVDGKDILFIDDAIENIEMARSCGWNTCQAYGYQLDKIKDSVETFLCNEGSGVENT